MSTGFHPSFAGFVRFDKDTISSSKSYEESPHYKLPPLHKTPKDIVINTDKIISYEPESDDSGMHLIYQRDKDTVCHIYGNKSIPFDTFHQNIVSASQANSETVPKYTFMQKSA